MSLITIAKTSNKYTFIVAGNIYEIPFDHPKINDIHLAAVINQVDEFLKLVNNKHKVEVLTNTGFILSGDDLLYDDRKIDAKLAETIIDMYREDKANFAQLSDFFINLSRNPDKSIQADLYKFLISGNIPITDDGHFLAYKKVTSDFKSIHPDINGDRIDHTPGNYIRMNRDDCCLDRNKTCAAGLHFYSKDYLPNYSSYDGNDKILIMKINPEYVTSIPADYNNSKGRCYEYYSLCQFNDKTKNLMDKKFVTMKKNTQQRRDPKTGRFMKKNNPIQQKRDPKTGRFMKMKVTKNKRS